MIKRLEENSREWENKWYRETEGEKEGWGREVGIEGEEEEKEQDQ